MEFDSNKFHLQIPIVFIHYGDSSYLRYSLQSAKLTNPQKEIYLLGDSENEHLKHIGIQHVNFSTFDNYPLVKKFDQVFKLIAGTEHQYHKSRGTDYWTNFVFKRWFYIYEFIKLKGISRFWTFDSDNMILQDLSFGEVFFQDYDTTEQCGGICMNGLINNLEVVEGYVEKMIELFQDEEYLAQQRKIMVQNPKWAYTEMRAYEKYKQDTGIKSVKLNSESQDLIFDDCISFVEDGMEMGGFVHRGRVLKKLYRDNNWSLYVRQLKGDRYLKLANLNLSWVDDYIFEKVLKTVLKRPSGAKHRRFIREFSLKRTFTDKVRSRLFSFLYPQPSIF